MRLFAKRIGIGRYEEHSRVFEPLVKRAGTAVLTQPGDSHGSSFASNKFRRTSRVLHFCTPSLPRVPFVFGGVESGSQENEARCIMACRGFYEERRGFESSEDGFQKEGECAEKLCVCDMY